MGRGRGRGERRVRKKRTCGLCLHHNKMRRTEVKEGGRGGHGRPRENTGRVGLLACITFPTLRRKEETREGRGRE